MRLVLLVYGLPLLALSGCDFGPAESLYDPDRQLDPDPVVHSLLPPERALAGVDEITIIGEHFAAETDRNVVFVGEQRAQILAASPEQIVIKAPQLPFTPTLSRPRATYDLRVAVIGAENFSTPLPYTLEAVSVDFADLKDFENAYGMTSDPEGNLYVSLFVNNVSDGIKKIAPDGTRSDYITTPFKWDDLALDDTGQLYAVRSVRAVFRFPAGGGTQETWAVIDDRTVRLTALTLDEYGYVWTGGPNPNLYRIAPTGTVEAIPFEATISDLVYHDGWLYIAAITEGHSVLYRMEVNQAQWGEPQLFFAFEDTFSARAHALAITADGALLVGSNAPDPLVLISPEGQAAPLFPGVVPPVLGALAWAQGTSIYARLDAANTEILLINTLHERP
ncbi:MAG: hypothetical protein KatS3mg043_0599 [Rhodothermaceae bacterium]|nr:MAG: hypothetical protein KatS3mg043_0599 [Rhodothermaceae bacterium]